MILACDPGINGGLTLIEDDGKIIYCVVMPVIKGTTGNRTQYDIQKIVKMVLEAKEKDPNLFAVLEKATCTPLAGKLASFGMGFYSGLMQGIFESLRVSYQIVTAKQWQKVILTGLPGDTKAKSILWCQRKYPDFDLRESPRCKISHDGKSDSLCIANYGRQIK